MPYINFPKKYKGKPDYIFGLGLGFLFGSMFQSNSDYPGKFPYVFVGIGASFMLIGLLLSFARRDKK